MRTSTIAFTLSILCGMVSASSFSPKAAPAKDSILVIAPGQLMPTEEDLTNSGYANVDSKSDDKFAEIPGVETTIELYRKGNDIIALYYLPNLKAYAVAHKGNTASISACIDEYNMGYCTRSVSEEEDFTLDFKAYGVTTTK